MINDPKYLVLLFVIDDCVIIVFDCIIVGIIIGIIIDWSYRWLLLLHTDNRGGYDEIVSY